MSIKNIEVIFKLNKNQARCVVRGGAWFEGGIGTRTARRYLSKPYHQYRGIGFRLVREV